jgi:hypothetical protein
MRKQPHWLSALYPAPMHHGKLHHLRTMAYDIDSGFAGADLDRQQMTKTAAGVGIKGRSSRPSRQKRYR